MDMANIQHISIIIDKNNAFVKLNSILLSPPFFFVPLYEINAPHMKPKFIFLAFSILVLTSCETLTTIINQVTGSGMLNGTAVIDNAAGLKEALNVGITNTVASVSKPNGFLGDSALKILLPAETDVIVDNIRLIPGGQTLVDNAILRLNRAAEDAAVEATPIFVSAIKGLTLTDAKSILFGTDTAATAYLRKSTYSKLKAAFMPKIEVSLNKDLVGAVSATESWTLLTSNYNKVAKSTAGQIAGLKVVTADLTDFVADRALQGLFLKVAAEEKNIRKNPAARINTLLKQVFGQLDAK